MAPMDCSRKAPQAKKKRNKKNLHTHTHTYTYAPTLILVSHYFFPSVSDHGRTNAGIQMQSVFSSFLETL